MHVDQLPDCLRPILHRATSGHLDVTPATQRFTKHRLIASPLANIFRYYDWILADGALQKRPVNLPLEKYEGRFLIQTDQRNITAQDAVAHYREHEGVFVY